MFRNKRHGVKPNQGKQVCLLLRLHDGWSGHKLYELESSTQVKQVSA